MDSSTQISEGNFDNVTEKKFEDTSPLLAVMGMLAFFSVLGTVGNFLVLYVYLRKRHKLAATVFIISLAATDFMTCLVIVPYTIAIEYLNYVVKHDLVCKLYMFFITSNVPFAAFIMVAIAFDRYLCIVHPFKHLMNAWRAKRISLSLATLAFTLGVITSLNYGVYQKVSCEEFHIKGNRSTGWQNSTFSTTSCIVNTGVCNTTEILLSETFTYTYQKIYSAFFILSLIIVMILYALVYRSVLIRRAKRRKQRKTSGSYSATKDTWFSENRYSFGFNYGSGKRGKDDEPKTQSEQVELARQMTIRERGLVANIRTAAMLFVVTAVFIVAFLPAWLMAHQLVPYNIVVFYMYFAYNVANPMIYAFMNKAFRRDLKEVFDCKNVQRDFV